MRETEQNCISAASYNTFLTFLQARIQELESSLLSEKEEFESQLADKEAAEEELQKQKEEAENEVYIMSLMFVT